MNGRYSKKMGLQPIVAESPIRHKVPKDFICITFLFFILI